MILQVPAYLMNTSYVLNSPTGGCYVEGDRLPNAWRWRDSVGPFEERPGHYGDVWNYWSDDGFGYYEGLQVFTS